MTEEVRTLARHRLRRAAEALQEAQLLLESGHANTYVNRLYYACFYAVSALMLLLGKSTAKHTNVRAFLHREQIRNGSLSPEFGQLYDRLFDNRQKADYVDLVDFDPEVVAPWYDEAERFVQTLTVIAEQRMQKEV